MRDENEYHSTAAAQWERSTQHARNWRRGVVFPRPGSHVDQLSLSLDWEPGTLEACRSGDGGPFVSVAMIWGQLRTAACSWTSFDAAETPLICRPAAWTNRFA